MVRGRVFDTFIHICNNNWFYLEINSMRILGDRVLVVPIEEDEIVRGLIISAIKEKNIKRGKVVSLGNTIEGDEINIGDTVLYEKIYGTLIEYDNCEYVMLRYEEILAVIKECKTK